MLRNLQKHFHHSYNWIIQTDLYGSAGHLHDLRKDNSTDALSSYYQPVLINNNQCGGSMGREGGG